MLCWDCLYLFHRSLIFSANPRRNRPKMVRQNHIEIDSDSSESKSHLLPWNTNTLPLPSKKHKEKLTEPIVTAGKLLESSQPAEVTTKKEEIKLREKSSRHRKYSLAIQTDKGSHRVTYLIRRILKQCQHQQQWISYHKG